MDITPTPDRSGRYRSVVILLILGGLFLIGVIPIAGLGIAWVFSGKDKSPDKTDTPPAPIADNKNQGEQKEPTKPPMSPEIKAAIDKGVAHLKKRLLQEENGLAGHDGWNRYADVAPVGRTALVGLALLESQVPPDDPVIQKALARVRAAAPQLSMVYALSTAILFMNRLHEAQALSEPDQQLLRVMALRLVAGQMADGRWSYHQPPLTPQAEIQVLAELQADQFEPRGVVQIMPSHSMTQFAILALWGSRKHVPVRAALLRAAAEFHRSQLPEGTWQYAHEFAVNPQNAQDSSSSLRIVDSNTCAGLLALAMEDTLRKDSHFGVASPADPPADPNTDKQRDAGFAHLAKVIGRTKDDPAAPGWSTNKIIKADAVGDYYFLWCLERVAVIYDKETIGGKDWYAWGSKVIVETQKDDGSWLDRHGDICDTCFALLFLT